MTVTTTTTPLPIQVPTPTTLLGNAPTEIKERAIAVCKAWLWTPQEIFYHRVNRTVKLRGVWMDMIEPVVVDPGSGGSSSGSSSSGPGSVVETSEKRRLRILSEIVVLESTVTFITS